MDTEYLPLPNPPCERCFNDPNCRVTGKVLPLVLHCQHRMVGAYFDGFRWTTYSPVSLAEFGILIGALEARVTVQSDSQPCAH